VTVVKVAEDGKFYVTNFPVTARHKLIAILDKKPNTEVLDFKAQNTNELSNSQKNISDGTDIIGQNNDGVNNLESDAIETGNEKVDTSFEPAEFDEEYAKANGIDLTGYMHNIDTSAIRHIFNNHGDVKAEDKRGQIAITDEDIKTLPNYIINNYDYIAFGLKNDKGLDVIAYAKNMPDGSSVYMEEVRTGKKTLTTDTLYKRKTGITSDIFRGILQSPIVQSTHTGTNIIGQNNDGVNNLESDAIETGNENIDTSFEPAEFDEEYAKAMEEQQRLLIEEMKESGAIPTIKSEKQRLKDMGIGKILRPKKDDPMYSEYKHLSPRIQREFFYDEKDSIINNSKGYTWDNAEHDLQQATNNDKASIWEELEDIDRNVSKYENLGLASGGEKNRKYDVNLIYDKNGKPVKIEFNDKLIDKNNVHPIELKEKNLMEQKEE